LGSTNRIGFKATGGRADCLNLVHLARDPWGSGLHFHYRLQSRFSEFVEVWPTIEE
jgi:hypothetical protein